MTRRARTQSPDARAVVEAAQSEKDYMAQIVKEAKLRGWRVYHTYDSRRSETGFPDLIMVRGASMLCLEVKRQTGKVTPEQQGWLDALHQVRFVTAASVRPSHKDTVSAILREAVR